MQRMERMRKHARLAAVALGLMVAGCNEEPSNPGTPDGGSTDGGADGGATQGQGTGTLSGQLAFTPAVVLFVRSDNRALVFYSDVAVTCEALGTPGGLPSPSKSVSLNLSSQNGNYSRAEDIEAYPIYREQLSDGSSGVFSEGATIRSLTLTNTQSGRYVGSFGDTDMLDGSGAKVYGTLSGTFDARVCP